MSKKQIVGLIFMSLILIAAGFLVYREYNKSLKYKNADMENEVITASIKPTKAPASTPESSSYLEAKTKLTKVEVIIPAILIEDTDIEQIKEYATKQGIEKVEINDDGSLTYTMSKSVHKQMLENLKITCKETIDSFVSQDNPSFKEVEYNDDFTEIILTVDKEKFEKSFDRISILGMVYAGMFYQAFDGSKIDVHINLKDNITDEIYGVMEYPENFEAMR